MSVKEKIIKHISSRLNDLLPGTKTVDAYTNAINKMSDKELEAFIVALEMVFPIIPIHVNLWR